MRRSAAATSLLILLAASAGGATPAPGDGAARHPLPAPTVEPTLALVLDLQVEGIEKAQGGVRARLILDLSAYDDLDDLVIRPILPDGLVAEDDTALPERIAKLPRGPARRYVLPLRARGEAKREIRFEVEFKDAQGRRFRLGQGVTLDPAAPAPGRLHLGAYEVMGTPLEEVRQ
ncbi:MAG TPA: hypothetical protein VJV75_09975 [Candidatus Polarisedimenticolia bacterium]|nr:hypothetical protein [Candidatus Polarisedimenticolia bacterium]